MGKSFLLVALSYLFTAHAADAQFWGAKHPKPIDTPVDSLKKGEFTWAPELAPAGPIVVSVSLDEQMAYTYRNGVLIGATTVSTGKKGHETPTGVFVTTLKDAKHRSSKYNNAPMPYTQRFTSDGIALHAGGLPGYPSSHGCVHLPSEYARLLFKESPLGMTVVVTNNHKYPEEMNHPAFLSPVFADGKMEPHEMLAPNERYRWQPELSMEGPASLLLSRTDKRLIVMRNGVEIGRCKISVVNESDSIGTHVYVAHDLDDKDAANAATVKWLAFPLADINYGSGAHGNPLAEGRIKIPDAFLKELGMLIIPGTTFMITDAPILPHTTGQNMAVMSTHPKDEASN